MGVRVCVVAGGTDQMLESQKLDKRPHIIVAMPGRLSAHLTGCNTLNFDALKFLVLDEADRLLGGEYDEDLKVIQKFLPANRQNLFFSATLKDFLKVSSIFPISSEVICMVIPHETKVIWSISGVRMDRRQYSGNC
jgi:ATP-dependent RNA helicase DDX49/DBP8